MHALKLTRFLCSISLVSVGVLGIGQTTSIHPILIAACLSIVAAALVGCLITIRGFQRTTFRRVIDLRADREILRAAETTLAARNGDTAAGGQVATHMTATHDRNVA